MKRILAVAIASLFALTTMLSGCGKTETKVIVEPKASTGTVEVNSEKLSDKLVTYKWMIRDDPDFPIQNDNPIFKYFEEKTNVKIEWQPLPAASYEDKLILLCSSNDIPDITWSYKLDYGPQGAYLPLDDLIQKNAPNMRKVWFDDKSKRAYVMRSGKTYAIPKLYSEEETYQYAWHYREDILKKLNLKEPVTVDDWYDTLKKVKDAYPDMIPFSMPKLEKYWVGATQSMYASGSALDFVTDKMRYVNTSDNQKGAIEFFAKLYKEKLLDQEFFTLSDATDFDQKMLSGKVFAFSHWNSNSAKYNELWKKNNNAPVPGAKFVLSVPPSVKYGAPFIIPRTVISSNTTVLSPKIKSPEIAIKFIDYIGYSKEGSNVLCNGIQNTHWTMMDYGPDFNKEQLEKVLSKEYAAGKLGSASNIPRVPVTYYYADANKNKLALDPLRPDFLAGLQKLKPFKPKMEIPLPTGAFATEVEVEKVTETENKANKVFEEYKLKFITGKEPMSNWDQYVQKMKALGVDELVPIYNGWYDKYKASLK